jgi:hypothetical protein
MWFAKRPFTIEEVLMAMVCGLDLHRRQITFDTVEVESGEEWRGRIWR